MRKVGGNDRYFKLPFLCKGILGFESLTRGHIGRLAAGQEKKKRNSPINLSQNGPGRLPLQVCSINKLPNIYITPNSMIFKDYVIFF